MKRLFIGFSALLLITGCSSLGNSLGKLTGFGEDNAPKGAALVKFEQEKSAQVVWSNKSGAGIGKTAMVLQPVKANDAMVVAHHDGRVVAHRLSDGQPIWQANLRKTINASPIVMGSRVIVGTADAHITLLDLATGAIQNEWSIANKPTAMNKLNNDAVIIKTIDAHLLAININDGKEIWHYQHKTPTLVLRGGSQPQVAGNKAIAGFADGKLVALNARNGELEWERFLALPKGPSVVQQIIGVQVDPVIVGNTIYAANYQGNLMAVQLDSGQTNWQVPFSTYSGLSMVKDNIYVVNDGDEVWSVNRTNGKVNWRQVDFSARGLTAPGIIGNALVLGDREGYLHWIAQNDGRHLARLKVGRDAIAAKPIVEGDIAYVITTKGQLMAVRF